MTMMPFHVLFPEEARTECRTVTPINQAGLPNRTFLFMELYCQGVRRLAPKPKFRRILSSLPGQLREIVGEFAGDARQSVPM
jgi:hypothetical protein